MARIRSIHPGLFTDEAWVSCSPLARVLIIGLWTEADDQGVFEWKPLTIKMRLLPVDQVNVTELLEELVRNQLIQSFEHGDKKYGAIRNFQKYQRPKKPNAIHPLPNQLRIYVGTKGDSSEPVPNQFPTGGEISPQMEDGGDNSISVNSNELTSGDPPKPFDLKKQIFGVSLDWLSKQSGKPPEKLRTMVGRWCSQYGDGSTLEALQNAARDGPIDPISWIESCLNGKGRKNVKFSNFEKPKSGLMQAYEREFGPVEVP